MSSDRSNETALSGICIVLYLESSTSVSNNTVPVPVAGPVAVNVVPTLLLGAPTKVKSVVPTDKIV